MRDEKASRASSASLPQQSLIGARRSLLRPVSLLRWPEQVGHFRPRRVADAASAGRLIHAIYVLRIYTKMPYYFDARKFTHSRHIDAERPAISPMTAAHANAGRCHTSDRYHAEPGPFLLGPVRNTEKLTL